MTSKSVPSLFRFLLPLMSVLCTLAPPNPGVLAAEVGHARPEAGSVPGEVSMIAEVPGRYADETGSGLDGGRRALPYLGVNSPSVTEGDAGTTTLTFTARLTDANGQPMISSLAIRASYQVLSEEGNTATAGADYEAASGTITFAPGETEKTIGVTVLGDTEDEDDETLTLRWTTWDGAAVLLVSYTATGTIVDDDDTDVRPYLGLNSPSAVEGDAGATTLTFTATLDRTSPLAINASYQVLSEGGNTATAGTDYTPTNGTLTFAPGETSKTVDVAVLGDTEDEDHETLTMRWTTWDGDRVLLVSFTGTGTILDDDDPPPPAVTIANASASEGNAITFTVTLDKAVPGGLTVTPSFTDGTATAGVDYTAGAAALAFAGTGGEKKTFSVATIEDDDTEDDETFTVTLGVSGTSHEVSASSTATGTIRDDDTPYLRLDSPSVKEGDAGTTTMTFTATLDRASPATINARYQVLSEGGNTATAGTDYTPTSGTLTFAPGETSKTVDVSVIGDTEHEGDETLTMKWTTWDGDKVLLVRYAATGTIEDDDAEQRPYLKLDSPSVQEGDSATTTLTFTARLTDENGRTKTSARTITAAYQVSSDAGNTATAGTDYTATSGTLTFAPGETEKTIDVTVMGDTDEEGDETLTMRWVIPWTNVLLASFTATGTIEDDDGAPTLTIANASADEGKAIAFTVTLDRAVPGGLTVTPSFTDGTATKGTDYTENTTALDFAGTAGETVSFTVATTADGDVENDETFTVALSVSGTTHEVTATSTATGTIRDDDDEATAAGITVDLSASVTTWNEGAAATQVTVTVTSDYSFIVPMVTTVYVGYNTDSATEGTDYNTVNSFAITIPGDDNTKSATGTFTLTPKQDALFEGDETIKVGGATNQSDVGVNPTTITLTDDDVRLTASVASVNEGDAAQTVTVTATAGSATSAKRGIGVYIGGNNDSATEGTDYATVAEHTINVQANQTTGSTTFTLSPTQDNSAEGDESLSITGWFAGGGSTVGTNIVIYDDDYSLSVNPSSVDEDAGTRQVTVTACCGTSRGARSVRVKVGHSGDTFREGTDYTTVRDFDITIAADATNGTGTFDLALQDDGVAEGGVHRISISGTSSHGPVAGTSIVVLDDDADPAVSLELNVTSWSEDGGAKTVEVTAYNRLDTYDSSWEADISVGKTGDSATEGTDYATVADFTIRSAKPGDTYATRSFTLTPTNDAAIEGTERISVTGTTVIGNAKVNSAFLNLTDDDATFIALSANKSSVSEGASATSVTVTATAAKNLSAASAVTVYVGDSGSADYGIDYAEVSDFTINIASGSKTGTGTFTLTPTDDSAVEGDETIGISGSVTGHSLTGTSLTLSENDTHAITLSASPDSVAEDDAATSVTVTATAGAAFSSARTVTVAVGGSGTATSGTDYAAVSNFDITIAANATSGTGTFTLTPTDDSAVEGDETIGIAGSGTSMTVTGTSLTLTEDDTHAITLSASPDSVAENDAATTVTVTATAGSAISTARTVSVVVGGSGDGATEGTDYATVADTAITIAANATSGTVTFTLTPTQDTSPEADESIGITGSGTLMTVTGTSLTLTDDDTRTIGLSVNKTTVGEGAGATSVTVTATANSAVAAATTVTVSVGASGDGATEGTDYTTVSDFTITIPADSISKTGTFTLTPTDDSNYEGEESVSISGSSSPHTVTGTSMAIGNNDGIAIALSASPDSVIEGGGATSVTVKASMGSTVALAAITVGVQVGKSSDSATEGTDYPTVNDFNLTIAKGDSTGTATFSIIPNSDKKDSEGSETISVDGDSSPHTVTGTSLTLQNATASNPITLSVSPSSVSEAAGATTITVTARMQASFQGAGSVTVTVGTSGSATSGTDYAAVSDITLNFSADSPTTATGTFTLTPTDDAVVENNETVWVDGTSSYGQVVGASVTINDNDGAAITLSANKTSVGEGASATSVTVTATAGAASSNARTVTVAVGANGDGAIEGTDYADVSNFTITIAANATTGTGTFTLTPTQDDVVEGSETLSISGSGTGLNVTGTSVTITDDDTAPSVNLSVNPSSVTEGAKDPLLIVGAYTVVTVTAAFSAAKSYAYDQTVTVSVGGTGTATSGTDYDAVTNFNVKIAAGDTTGTATFRLASTDDSVYEGDETIGVAGSATGLTVNSANLTLADNDSAAVTVNDASASEGDSITFTVTLDNAVEGGLTVTPSFTDVTAVEGTDYDENTADLSFTGTANETKTFKVATTQDAVVESDETFTVGLTVSDAPSGVTSTDTGTGTVDDDASGNVDSTTLTINDASADEGGDITFTVTLDNAVEGGLTVTPSYTNGTAASGDYTTNTSGLSFTGTADETKTFTVSTTEDAVVEANETFTVGLSVSGTTLASRITSSDTGTGTINNDDGATVTVANASASEGESITFTVTLGAAVQGGLTVTPDFTDVTAVEGTDYDENTGALSFTGTANETKTFTVSTTEDAVLEADETFTVGLTVSGTTLSITSTDTGTGTVTNDDDAEVTVNDASASEGDSITFTVTLDKAVQGGLTVTPGYTNGTTASGDYTKNTSALSFTGTKGETQSFKVTTKEDAVLEADETFTVGLTVSDAPSGVTSTDTGTGTIDDDDDATVTVNDASASEGGEITFTVTLDKAVQGGLKVTPGYTNGTAESGDYTKNTTALTFAGTANETKTFKVATKEDAVLETDETFTVGLTVSDAPSGVTSTDTGTGTIDNDDAATVTIEDESASEGAGITFTITLDKAVQGGFKVTPSYTNGTAESGDYTANTTAVSFTGTANETRTFTVSTTEDAVLEANETFTVGLTVSDAPTGVTSTDTGVGTINDDDNADLSLTDPSTDEGGTLTFDVTLNAAVQGGLTVTPGYTDGTAVEGTDYDENTTALNFTGTMGEKKSFTVSTTEDAVLEADETFTVGLTVSNTSLNIDASATGTGTINNDDSAEVTVADATASEGEGITFTVTLSEAVQGGLTVTPGYTDGTADEGTDYDKNTTALSFTGTKGETKTFTVSTTEDKVVESDETFTVGLAVSGTSLTIASTDTGTGTIDDDDQTPEVDLLVVDGLSVGEGESAKSMTVTASFSNGNTFPVDKTVKVGVGGGTAVQGVDFEKVSDFDITIKKLQLSATGTFTLTPINDRSVEGNETIELSGSVPGLTVNIDGVTIDDDDPASDVRLSVDPAQLDEDAETVVTVTAELENGNTFPEDRTVTVSVGGGTATADADYAAVSNFDIVIPKDQLSATGTFTLAPVDDGEVEGDETIEVSGVAGSLTVHDATMTLLDDDQYGIALSASPSSVDEDAGATEVTVTATAESADTEARVVTVAVGAGGDGAVEGTDYAAVADFQVTIPANATSGTGTFTLTPTDDGEVEGEETISVTGSSWRTVVRATAVTLVDDDRHAVSLSVVPARVSEGASETLVRVTAAADKAVAKARVVTVAVGAAEDGATEGVDYAAVGNVAVTIPANETSGSQVFRLTPVDDEVVEGDEAISVTGSGANMNVEGTALTLEDDDSDAVRLSASPARVSEDASATTVTVTATATAAVAEARVVTVAVGGANDGATAGVDYAAVADFGVTIPANATSATGTFTLTPTDDDEVEGDEAISVTGSGASLNVVGTSVTLADDDQGVVALTVDPASVDEGATANVTVTASLRGGLVFADARVVTVAVGGGTAEAGADYAAVAGFGIAIPAGGSQGSAVFTLATTGDDEIEGDETIRVTGSSPGIEVLPAEVVVRDATGGAGIGSATALVALDDRIEVDEGGTASVLADGAASLLANDSVPAAMAGGLSVALSGEGPAHGDLVLNADGTFTYTHDGSENHADGFAYAVSAGDSTRTAAVAIEVGPVNDAPVARDDTVTVVVGAVASRLSNNMRVGMSGRARFSVLANDSDAETSSSELTAELVTLAAADGGSSGDFELRRDGTFRYAHKRGGAGTDLFSYVASDGEKRSEPATVHVRIVANDGPRFDGDHDFDLLENRDGSGAPVELGRVKAEDPNVEAGADELEYALANGPPELFSVDPKSGEIAYVGPGEDAETPPDSYALTVRVTDTGGLSDSTAVRVRIVDENETPLGTEIPDQMIELGTTATLGLAGHFSDPDGDTLSYAATAETAGIVELAVAGDSVAVVSVGDGPDRVRVTVVATDRGGLAAEQSFDVEVVMPVEQATRALELSLAGIGRTIATQAVDAIGGRFEASSRLARAAEGGGLSAASAQGIAAILEAGGVDMGAMAAALDVFGGAGMGGLGGGMGLGGAGGMGAGGMGGGLGFGGGGLGFGGPGAGGVGGGVSLGGGAQAGGHGGGLGFGSLGGGFGGGLGTGGLTGRSSFANGGGVSLGLGSDSTGAGGWTLWGSGARTDFSGRPDGFSIDGSMDAAYLGIDRSLGSSGVVGVAVSRNQGGVDFEGASHLAGDVRARLTTFYPYVRWSPTAKTDLWGVVGLGGGDVEMDAAGTSLETPGRLRMAAMGLRNDLARVGAVDLAVRADAFTVGMEADAVAGMVGAADGRAQRLRLVLDGSADLALSSSSRLTPSVEVGARADGGDVETGPGMELGGGLAFANARLGLDIAARARWLAVHRDEHFGEWGGNLSVRRMPANPERGLSFSLEPAWGEDASGIAALWEGRGLGLGGFGSGLRPEDAEAAWRPDRLDMELAYGAGLPGGRGSLRPFGRLMMMGAGSRHLRVGTRLELGGGAADGGLALELLGEQRAQAGGASVHGAGLNLRGANLSAAGGLFAPFGGVTVEGASAGRLTFGTLMQLTDGEAGTSRGLRLQLAAEAHRRVGEAPKYGLVLRGTSGMDD